MNSNMRLGIQAEPPRPEFKWLDDRPIYSPRRGLVVIAGTLWDVNFRELYDRIHCGRYDARIVLRILEGAAILSTSPADPALDTGVFPTGVTIGFSNRGRIQGAGGEGGAGGDVSIYTGAQYYGENGFPGGAGGLALKVRAPTTIDNSGGEIFGGGGGGGGGGSATATGIVASGGGGGGAGRAVNCDGGAGGKITHGAWGSAGADGSDGGDGTTNAAGSGGNGATKIDGNAEAYGGKGGNGGGAGQAGQTGAGGVSKYYGTFYPSDGGAGGSAGDAINGESQITWTAEGDIRGPRN